MIDVTNREIFRSALRELVRFRRGLGPRFRGRFFQLFLAMKFYQNELPSMFSNQFVSTEVLQTLLDDLYAKASRPLNDCVLVLFENNYLARTGLIAPGNRTSQNTWRNNFNLQKGIGCYAPPQDLASQTFLDQSRRRCRYLQPRARGVLAGATCQLCTTGAMYRNEDHRKWLRIDSGGSGYAVVDLMNIENFRPYIAIAPDRRTPILPLMVSVYHDALPGLLAANRNEVDVAEFASDFNFSAEELNAYFDQDNRNQFNHQLTAEFPDLTYRPIGVGAPIVRRRAAVHPRRRAAGRAAIPQPILVGTPVPPPGVNTGWEAEEYVAAALRGAEWTVYNVSRQRLGYDLYAQRGRQTRYLDVKSSLGFCSPTFTAREWQQAATHGESYVLAVVENFNPNGQNAVFWIPDPANVCTARQATTLQYSISRNSWVSSTVAINDI